MYSAANFDVGIEVSITDDCLDILLRNRRGKGEAERGGLLFAQPYIGERVTVSNVSEPKNKDRAGKYFFIPNSNSAQREINIQFKDELAYIGDWHTHPSKHPRPSHKDITTINAIFKESTHDLNYMLIIIIGTSDDFCDNYIALSDGNTLYELKCIESLIEPPKLN